MIKTITRQLQFRGVSLYSLLGKIKEKITNSFFKNTGWLVVEHIFRMILSILVTGLMARYLGTYQYGLISYGMAYITIFTTICKLGIDGILVNEIIRDRKATGELVGTTIILRLISSILSILIIFIIVRYLNPNNILLHIITLIQSFSLIFISLDTVSYWFQSNLQSKYAVIPKSIAFFIASLWRLLLIYFNASIEFFAGATVLESLIVGIFVLGFYFRYGGPRFRVSFNKGKKLLSEGYHFIVAGLLITVYTQMDKIMLGQLGNESMVGIYAAAMTIAGFWMFIPGAIIESARPLIMSAKINNEVAYLKKIKQLYSAIIWIGIIASIFISLLSKQLTLIIFGSAFIESQNVLIGLIWSRIFSLIGVTRSIWLVAENKIRFQKYFVGIGAVVNIILNLIFIPKYGAVGAAVATIFAEIFSSTISLLLFKETRPLLRIIFEAFMFRKVF